MDAAGQLSAVRACQDAVRESPGSAGALFNLGLELSELQGDLDGEPAALLAVSAYLAALALEPDDADTHYNLGMCYDSIGPEHTALAAASFRRAVELDPGATDGWTNLGVALKASGDLAGAVAAHTQAFERDEALREVWAVRLLGLEEEGAFGTAAVTAGPGAVLGRWGAPLRDAGALLRDAGYSSRSAVTHALGLAGDDALRWPTGGDYFALRLDADVQDRLRPEQAPWSPALRLLLRLHLLGCAVPEEEANTALGSTMLATLTRSGLIVPCQGAPGCLISPVPVYPLFPLPSAPPSDETLLLCTDWSVDTLCPGVSSVMAIGMDSLELVRHPPRPVPRLTDRADLAATNGGGEFSAAAAAAAAGGSWLDLCTGSGVQGISALAWAGRAPLRSLRRHQRPSGALYTVQRNPERLRRSDDCATR